MKSLKLIAEPYCARNFRCSEKAVGGERLEITVEPADLDKTNQIVAKISGHATHVDLKVPSVLLYLMDQRISWRLCEPWMMRKSIR